MSGTITPLSILLKHEIDYGYKWSKLLSSFEARESVGSATALRYTGLQVAADAVLMEWYSL
jgi:hypothetical protein